MSLTMTVPAAVPSLFQSSMPLVPSLAAKKSVLPTTEVARARAVSAGIDVLDQHGARGGAVALPELVAVVPSVALKNSVPLSDTGGDVTVVPKSIGVADINPRSSRGSNRRERRGRRRGFGSKARKMT